MAETSMPTQLQGTRTATHAGTWYSDQDAKLKTQLDEWLNHAAKNNAAEELNGQGTRVLGIIGPHAGYSYSGRTAAFAYNELPTAGVERIFLLGPSHHWFTRKSAMTQFAKYATPLGDLEVDAVTVAALLATKEFEIMSENVDEAEHSLELHLPYIVYTYMKNNCPLPKIVPWLVGSTTPATEDKYGKILAEFLRDPKTAVIVSSDFCHWGRRFDYRYYNEHDGQIHESISKLDHAGMEIIESGDPKAFSKYLVDTGNTICGRHPIGVLLCALRHKFATESRVKFNHYEQSSQCRDWSDSSVSYASAIVVVPE